MIIVTTAKAKAIEQSKNKNHKLLKKYWDLLYPPNMVDRMTLDRPRYDK